jgi:uncharacterized protein
MASFFALLAGAVFGIGLIVSGTADPRKVIGFLDFAGPWDPSLAFVMGGAIAIGAPTFAFMHRRKDSLLGLQLKMPAFSELDRRLIAGSLLFGIGWGIAGFCPGPALVALGMGETKAVVFVAAMLAGMGLYEFLNRRGLTGQAWSA